MEHADKTLKCGIANLGLALLLMCAGAVRAAAVSPAGLWQVIDDRTGGPEAWVRVVDVDGDYRGTVVRVFSPPASSADPRCDLCAGEYKGKPVVGMTILRGLRREGDEYRSGMILDPDEGVVYRCSATLLDGGRRLELRGYVGVPLFGRTQVWIRLE